MAHTPPTPRYCPNCHYPLPDYGTYCSQCGQKYSTGRVSFGELVREFLEAVLNFDSKIFRTLRDIFIPGKLTLEYFKGHHRRYVSPVRLFLALAVVFIFAIGFFQGEKLDDLLRENRSKEERAAYQAYFLNRLDTARTAVLEQFGRSPRLVEALDSLGAHFEDTRRDSTFLVYLKRSGANWYDVAFQEMSLPVSETEMTPEEEIISKYDIGGWLNTLIIRQQMKLKRDAGSFLQFLLGKLIWMMLLMMPALALLLKLLYIRRGQYYVEHLIFSFHYHSFAFLLLSIALAIEYPGIDWTGVAGGLTFLYLLVAMKRVYRQGWGKTLVKYFILNFFYVVVFSVALLITAAAGMLLF